MKSISILYSFYLDNFLFTLLLFALIWLFEYTTRSTFLLLIILCGSSKSFVIREFTVYLLYYICMSTQVSKMKI